MDTTRKARLTQEILKEAEKLPQTKIVRRRWNNARRRQANKPITGVFYWIPIPNVGGDGIQWDFLAFHDEAYGGPGEADHAKVWPDVVHNLAFKWHKPQEQLWSQLEDDLYGLPRGRVNLMANRQYGVAHGNDSPIPNWEYVIKKEFQLKDAAVIFYEDSHERMIPPQPQNIQKALGIKKDLGLKTIDLDEEFGD